MSLPASLLCAIFSSLALVLGIPNELFPSGSALFGLAALVPLYIALMTSRSWFRSGLITGLMIAGTHLLSSYWLANFREFAIFTLGATTLACFFAGFLVGFLLRYALSFPAQRRPFLFACVWTVWEWGKSTGFLAYPWGTLVMTSRGLPHMIQIARLTGTWGIGWLFALISAILAEITLATLHADGKNEALARNVAFTVLLVIAANSYGAIRLANPAKPDTTVDILVVQQNVNSWDADGTRRAVLVSEKLTRNAIANAGEKKPDLVVWSESTLPWAYAENRDYYANFPPGDPLATFLAETDTPLLVGTPVRAGPGPDDYSNGVVLISPTGDILDSYRKIQLIAFAEYLPFTEYAPARKFYTALVGFSSGWIPGTELKTLALTKRNGDEIRLATPICFEDAFSDLVARLHNTGSDLVVNLTNDSWALVPSAEYQHFAIASFRTIELGTTLVRSTNSGYSVVVNPEGTVTAELPLFRAAAAYLTVPVYPQVMTFYARFRDWFPLLMLLILLYSMLRQTTRRKGICIDNWLSVR
jgi:apolipoprotein N-acyltransferase